MSAEQSLTEYYNKKGKVRFMMVVNKEVKSDLSKLCKELKLSQGELLEVLLSLYGNIDPIAMNLAVQAKRGAKASSRVSLSAISKKLKGLSKEELAAIEKMIDEQKTKDAEKVTNEAEFS